MIPDFTITFNGSTLDFAFHDDVPQVLQDWIKDDLLEAFDGEVMTPETAASIRNHASERLGWLVADGRLYKRGSDWKFEL